MNWTKLLHSSLGVTSHIDQPGERKGVVFEVPYDDIDGTKSERLSMDYHQGWLIVFVILSP
jgi:hypothetical protein